MLLRMRIVGNLKSKIVKELASGCIAEGPIIQSEAFQSCRKPLKEKWLLWELFDADGEMLEWLRTIDSYAKAFIQGTYHGLDKKYLHLFDQLLNAIAATHKGQ